MHYSSAWVDVVSEDAIKELCPEEWHNFMQALEKEEFTLEDYAKDRWDSPISIDDALQILITAFDNKTKNAGLKLDYHDSENKYDGVRGAFWKCENLFQLSPAGEILKSKFSRETFIYPA